MLRCGRLFRQTLQTEKPLIIAGTINAYTALLAEQAGHKAIYLSGAGVANASYGLPDLGITSLNDVLIDAERITGITSLPLLVDIDTGWGGAFNIAKTIKSMIKAGVAAVHMEDQIQQKRCGHRPNKSIVSTEEMCDRIKAAVDAKTDADFFIIARTDALANEGIEKALERANAYINTGADAIFLEAATELSHYEQYKKQLNAPVLANITEFGNTPLFTPQALSLHGVDMVLYPLTAFRAMSQTAQKVYQQLLRTRESQEKLLPEMQTRASLYETLNYYAYEKKLDDLFK